MVYLAFIIFIIGMAVTDRWLGGALLLGAIFAGGCVIHLIRELIATIQTNKNIRSRKMQEIERTKFLAIVSSLIAKIAKADGVIAASEIRAAEECFIRFGVVGSPEKDFCINVFRLSKDDSHTAYDYADLLVETTKNAATRELVYEMLWDMAAADDVLSAEEDAMLKRLADRLQLPIGLYERFKSGKFRRRDEQKRNEFRSSQQQSTTHSNLPKDVRKAYETLGCEENDSIDDLKRKYRQLAMRYHPDHLRQDGVPEYIIKKMHVRMAEINAAWERVCKYKGIR